MDRAHGYEFMVALTDAIESACADDAAFRYEGHDLGPALERDLWVRLSNTADLYAAFVAARKGRPVPEVRSGSRIEADVARALLPAGSAVRTDRARRALRAAARSVRRAGVAAPAPVNDAGVCFVLHQPKFMRFLEPVIGGLGPVAFVSLGRPMTETLERRGVPHLALDRPPGRPRGNVGPALSDEAHLATGFDRLRDALAAMRPRLVAVVEGNSPGDELAARAAAAVGVPSVCLQQGWSPIVHPGFRRMTHTRMTVWGEGFAELLRPVNPGLDFAVTGAHVLEAPPSGGTLAARLAGRSAVGLFLQSQSPLIAEDDTRKLRALAGLLAARMPESVVLVREHPGAPLTPAQVAELAVRPNVLLAPAAEYGLREVIDACTVVSSIYSTTLLEAAALGTPPVVLAVTSMERLLPDLGELGAAAVVRDWDDAAAEIARLVASPERRAALEPGMRAVRERYFAGLDGGALDRIVGALSRS